MSIQDTLQERGNRYGDFTDHAKIAQDLQAVMQGATTARVPFEEGGATPWLLLSPIQRQALTVIADKIARILSGDPNYADNWHDIQGYAKLVEERLPVPAEAAPANDNARPAKEVDGVVKARQARDESGHCYGCGRGEHEFHIQGCPSNG